MSTFPQPFKSSVSHWQATNRGPTSLYLHNASVTSVPGSADIVIVGGGMMGASLSYFLTREGAEGRGKNIILVEAKDVASGASGRNGGHVGPATANAYHHLIQPYPRGAGLDSMEAVKVIQNERDNLELIADIIDKEGIKDKVDFWKGDLCEVHETQQQSTRMKQAYEQWISARHSYGLSGTGDTQFIDDAVQAKKISRFNEVSSIQLRPAGSVHSHKLATQLMTLALQSPHANFQLFSWTPVASIDQDEKEEWIVKTSKGTIRTPRVILCTNAHTQNFFPKEDPLTQHVRPRLEQCTLITPTEAYSGSQALNHTYNMPDVFYLVQTPMGGIVLGGGYDILVREGKIDADWRDTVEDDSKVIDVWTELQSKYCKEKYAGWGDEALGEGLTRVWTGILTEVKDTLPVVGQVPGKKGMFVSVGFHGHGMSRIFAVGRALAETLRTGEWNEDLLPRSFEYTAERLERLIKIDKALEEQGIDVKQFRDENNNHGF